MARGDRLGCPAASGRALEAGAYSTVQLCVDDVRRTFANALLFYADAGDPVDPGDLSSFLAAVDTRPSGVDYLPNYEEPAEGGEEDAESESGLDDAEHAPSGLNSSPVFYAVNYNEPDEQQVH